MVTKNYSKRVELGDTYDMLITTLILWYDEDTSTQPARQSTKTISLTGVKGPMVGDNRMDTVTTTLFQDGALVTSGPTVLPMLMKNPYEGLTDDDMIAAAVQSKLN